MAGPKSTASVHHLKGHMNTTVIHSDPKNARLWYIVLVLGSLLVLGIRTLFVRLYIPTAFIWRLHPLYQCNASEIVTNFEDNYFIIICRTRMDYRLWMLWEERRIWLAYQVSVSSSSNLPMRHEQVFPKKRRQLSIPCKAFYMYLVYDS